MHHDVEMLDGILKSGEGVGSAGEWVEGHRVIE